MISLNITDYPHLVDIEHKKWSSVVSSEKSYKVDRALHWLSALAIMFLLFDMGTRIHNIDYRIKGAAEHKQDAIEIHVIAASILFFTLIARLIWYKWFLLSEYQLTYDSVKQKWLVRTVHTAMYGTLFLMMISGVFMITNYEHPLNLLGLIKLSEAETSTQTFYDANNWHLYFESALYFLILTHITGALYNRR